MERKNHGDEHWQCAPRDQLPPRDLLPQSAWTDLAAALATSTILKSNLPSKAPTYGGSQRVRWYSLQLLRHNPDYDAPTIIQRLWCTNYDDAPTISTNYAPTLFFTAPVPAPVMFPMKMVKSSAAMIFAELCADAEKRAEPSGCFRSKHFCNLSTEGCFRSKHLGYLSLRIVINPKCFFVYLSVMCPQ